MKTSSKLFAGVVLTLILTSNTFAGDIHTPFTAPPPPATVLTAEGDIAAGVAGPMDTPKVAGDIHTAAPTSDTVFQAALNLLRGVMALF